MTNIHRKGRALGGIHSNHETGHKASSNVDNAEHIHSEPPEHETLNDLDWLEPPNQTFIRPGLHISLVPIHNDLAAEPTLSALIDRNQIFNNHSDDDGLTQSMRAAITKTNVHDSQIIQYQLFGRADMLTERRVDSDGHLRDAYDHRRHDVVDIGTTISFADQSSGPIIMKTLGLGVTIHGISQKEIQDWFHTVELPGMGRIISGRLLPERAGENDPLQYKDVGRSGLEPWIAGSLNIVNPQFLNGLFQLKAGADMRVPIGQGEFLFRGHAELSHTFLKRITLSTGVKATAQVITSDDFSFLDESGRQNLGLGAHIGLSFHRPNKERYAFIKVDFNGLIGREAYGESAMATIGVAIPLGGSAPVTQVGVR